jgi:NMD protein affecting ribosome stability and mRNA decay
MRRDESHDPTKRTKKLADPTVCPGCGATYRDGRWTWKEGPVEAPRHLCAACERVRDRYPAGFVTARGRFALEHRDEIIRIARNTESAEKQEHPIKRIMNTIEDAEGVVFETTEFHLAQAIGRAIHGAFKGDLDISFAEDIIRVNWSREA